MRAQTHRLQKTLRCCRKLTMETWHATPWLQWCQMVPARAAALHWSGSAVRMARLHAAMQGLSQLPLAMVTQRAHLLLKSLLTWLAAWTACSSSRCARASCLSIDVSCSSARSQRCTDTTWRAGVLPAPCLARQITVPPLRRRQSRRWRSTWWRRRRSRTAPPWRWGPSSCAWRRRFTRSRQRLRQSVTSARRASTPRPGACCSRARRRSRACASSRGCTTRRALPRSAIMRLSRRPRS